MLPVNKFNQRTLSGGYSVGVIGSAGRLGDSEKMTGALYERMLEKLKKVIMEDFKLDLKEVRLISGGAAWADHLAVTLFLQGQVPALTLHLPAPWKPDVKACFVEDLKVKGDPGNTSNKYHREFSKKLKENTLSHIDSARLVGAKFIVHNGFKNRNAAVAKESQYLVAFTWNDDTEPKRRSGTADTWAKWKKKKEKMRAIHISLSSLVTQSNSSNCGLSSDPTNPQLQMESDTISGDSMPPAGLQSVPCREHSMKRPCGSSDEVPPSSKRRRSSSPELF